MARTARRQPGSAGSAAAESPWARGAARLRESRALLALFAASVVLALGGAGLVLAGAQARGSPAAGNRAVTDQAATRQVISVIGADVTRIFSYSSTDLPATKRTARQVLAGSAASQYDELFPQLRSAAGQQLTVVTRVKAAGVIQLSGGTARLLVFLNQTATREHAQGGGTPSSAQLVVIAQLRSGRWRITGIEAR